MESEGKTSEIPKFKERKFVSDIIPKLVMTSLVHRLRSVRLVKRERPSSVIRALPKRLSVTRFVKVTIPESVISVFAPRFSEQRVENFLLVRNKNNEAQRMYLMPASVMCRL